jgi:hypothetical protein
MFYLGVDLGKSQDHSAIAIVERPEPRGIVWAQEPECLELRYAERVPLGTPYTEVAARVRRMAKHANLRSQCTVAVDATGVGEPVMDMLRAESMGCEVSAVKITGGEMESQAGAVWNVPKRNLLAGLQVLLEKKQLKIARRLAEAGPLVRELTNVQMTMGSGGRVRMSADGYGEHDDLVIALALACWKAMKKKQYWGFGTQRLL